MSGAPTTSHNVSSRPVLIAGGGIGGMATALTLHQIGMPCIVFESVPELQPLGVGINLQPNAVRELHDLGFGNDVLDTIGLQAREWALVGRNGNEVYAEPRGLDAGYHWPQYAVHRGQLQMTLFNAVKERLGDSAVQLGQRVVGYRQAGLQGEVKESVYLTAKTSAMVCWLFVGSAIFSAAFALLGGQELVEQWVLGMNLSKTQFLILTQVIIFILGWPLEWTEIIVIVMPIFVPLLDNFGVDPLFFGLLVALNLQTAFLSPPVAMAAFYLKGVSPPHVTLNQIFLGMLPFMGIQILAIVLLYVFPQIGLWLPQILYK